MDTIKFDQAISDTDGEDRILLLGNGFSSEYFSYRNLLENSGIQKDSFLWNLFNELNTNDFELVMRNLEDAALVESVYNLDSKSRYFNAQASELRESLIHAINVTHPNQKNSITDKIKYCITFIKKFESIFTLNYDLLLYWARLEDTGTFSDGFGLSKTIGRLKGPYSIEAHCNIFNLHGGLHLFQTKTNEVEKCIASDGYIVTEITNIIKSDRRLPLYVAEGTSEKKLAKIRSVPYLLHCYNKLKNSAGNIFIYGHSASENDEHIYKAIFSSKISKIYFCVYKPDNHFHEINGRLQKYKAINNKKIIFVDSESASVWS